MLAGHASMSAPGLMARLSSTLLRDYLGGEASLPNDLKDILSRPAEDMLADTKWQNVSWRTGTKAG